MFWPKEINLNWTMHSFVFKLKYTAFTIGLLIIDYIDYF